jgi:hypothetical protein
MPLADSGMELANLASIGKRAFEPGIADAAHSSGAAARRGLEIRRATSLATTRSMHAGRYA